MRPTTLNAWVWVYCRPTSSAAVTGWRAISRGSRSATATRFTISTGRPASPEPEGEGGNSGDSAAGCQSGGAGLGGSGQSTTTSATAPFSRATQALRRRSPSRRRMFASPVRSSSGA
jgi:hypothetical protein